VIKSQFLFCRHCGPGLKISRTGCGQNPVRSISYWMLALDNNIPGQAFTSMTVNVLNQRFLN